MGKSNETFYSNKIYEEKFMAKIIQGGGRQTGRRRQNVDKNTLYFSSLTILR